MGELTLTVAKSRCAPQCSSTRAKSAARSVLSLLAPRFNPRTASRGRFARRSAMASMPWLLNPNRLIAAWSSVRRKRRGFGLPGCGRGVAAPTSKKPNPARERPRSASAFLSKPAASPRGLARLRPATVVRRRGEVTRPGEAATPSLSAEIARPWAVSGSRR